MARLKISIAMCTYMGEGYLREQLDSIARQTRLPDELVICDDDSRDCTLRIVNSFAASAPFPVRFFRNDNNLGSTKNFQQAISLCKGDIIALSDQDDVWHNNKLSAIEQAFLESENVGLVFSNASVVDQDLIPLGYTLWDRFVFGGELKSRCSKGRAFEVLLNHNVVTGATMAFKAKLRDNFLPIPASWVHDSWIAIVISSASVIKMIDECLIDYRQHEKQQIGGIKKSLAQNVELAQSVSDYAVQIAQYRTLGEFLDKNSDNRHSGQVYDKISHLEARCTIYKVNLARKLFYLGREIYKNRYHKYSNGFYSIGKDLMLTKQ